MPFRADRNEHLLSQPARTSPWPGRGSADVLLRSIPLALIHIVTEPVQAQSQYELTPAVWIGEGRQQIRVRAKGSSAPVGSVDVHFDQPGKAFISGLEVAQAHRQHGLGSMLIKAALESARRQGSTATKLEANPGLGSISRPALVSMYQKLGFRNSGM